jgi:hypothetical protein
MGHAQRQLSGAHDLFAALADPSVTSVSLELGVASLPELHTELVKLFLFCLAQLHGSTTLSSEMIDAKSSAEVCTMFAKLGVVCHIDDDPPVPAADALAAFHSTCVSNAATHTIAFSLSRQRDTRPCRTSLLAPALG